MTAAHTAYPTEAQCRSCRARVIWGRTEQWRSMPVDAEPDRERGNLTVTAMEGRPPRIRPATDAERAAGQAHTSHFATCPEAAGWRMRKALRATEGRRSK